ncbi:4-hydroxy-tetrahydrodipicolinate reductase [Gorillibacterium massiliense]|uniref:4-hydroxy-tetrahydrodipicolinate reductase n=1 Tax=Gorillibacterium massiliense TaxID=1280390 RepID=UPI0004B81D75|nr:4-hydroxy-tetrahydrodipicolinate reductase [Gorillibacterium massiliense]
MTRVGIVGGTGKLGRDIVKMLIDHKEISIGAVVTRKGSSFVGKDLSTLTDNGIAGVVIEDELLGTGDKCDLYMDCTSADSFLDNYDAYVENKRPVIFATTGFEPVHMDKIQQLAERVPVVVCPNFSIGVYKFLKLIKLAAVEFGVSADIDIIEYHHKFKKDKPSGTALAIADALRDSGFERDITMHSVRAGNIIGEHHVQLTTDDNERIEISHKAYSREGFSKGVLETIHWIMQKEEAGLYGIGDIFR